MKTRPVIDDVCPNKGRRNGHIQTIIPISVSSQLGINAALGGTDDTWVRLNCFCSAIVAVDVQSLYCSEPFGAIVGGLVNHGGRAMAIHGILTRKRAIGVKSKCSLTSMSWKSERKEIGNYVYAGTKNSVPKDFLSNRCIRGGQAEQATSMRKLIWFRAPKT